MAADGLSNVYITQGVVDTSVTPSTARVILRETLDSQASPGQVWRYTPSTGLFNFIAQGGADPSGGNASNFSFVGAKTNLLTLDPSRTLWIGDDTSNATGVGAGRLRTISATALLSITGGSPTAGANTQLIANVLRGPWETLVVDTIFTPTFNADGTFSATIQSVSGTITTDAGTWTLTPPIHPQTVGNPQGHLTLTDARGVVLLSGDVLLLNADQLFMESATDSVSSVTFVGQLTLTKMVV